MSDGGVKDVGDEEWHIHCHVTLQQIQNLSVCGHVTTAIGDQLRHAVVSVECPQTRVQIQIADRVNEMIEA